MITVKAKLPNGTLILSNGFKVLPSIGTMPDGSKKPVSEMSESEHQQFISRLEKYAGQSV